MDLKRSLTAVCAVLLTAGLVSNPASAAPAAPAEPSTRDFANGAERNQVAATAPPTVSAETALRQAAPQTRWVHKRQGYPRQTEQRVYPENPADRTIKLGLVLYHAIAQKHNALHESSETVSVM